MIGDGLRSVTAIALVVTAACLVGLTACRDGGAGQGTERDAESQRQGSVATVLVLLPDWLPAMENDANLAVVRASFQAAGYGADRLRIQAEVVPAMPGEGTAPIRAAVKRWSPDVVIAATMGSAMDLQQLGLAVPVVFAGGADPLDLCLVDSMQRPGRNATGHTSSLPIEAKMVELLVDAFPRVRRLTVLVDGNVMPSGYRCGPAAAQLALAERVHAAGCQPGPPRDRVEVELTVDRAGLEGAASGRGLPIEFEVICQWEDVEATVQRLAGLGDAAGVAVPEQFLFQKLAGRLPQLLNQHRVVAVFGSGRYAEAGALLAVGARRQPPGVQEAAEMARLVIEGARPADMPVRTPRAVAVWVNLVAARTSGRFPSAEVVRAADVLIR